MLNELELTDVQLQIKRWIDRLDEHVISLESTWGIGNLFKFASPELMEKFNKQKDKLNDAVQKGNLKLVAELTEGTIRGWNALEADAVKNGHTPPNPECWDIKMGDFHMRLAKTVTAARGCTESGVVVFCLEEVARMMQSTYRDVYEAKKHIPDAVVENVTEPFDFDKGDELPW